MLNSKHSLLRGASNLALIDPSPLHKNYKRSSSKQDMNFLQYNQDRDRLSQSNRNYGASKASNYSMNIKLQPSKDTLETRDFRERDDKGAKLLQQFANSKAYANLSMSGPSNNFPPFLGRQHRSLAFSNEQNNVPAFQKMNQQ